MSGGFARLWVIALLASSPAAALEYSSSRFAQLCREQAPRATCECVIGRLAASPDGRFGLESYEVLQTQQGAGQRRAMIDVLDRYNMRPSDAQAAISRLKASLDTTIKACL